MTRPLRLALTGQRVARIALVVAIVVALVSVLGKLAPTAIHKPVSPSSIPAGAVTGNPCGLQGRVVRAVLVNDVAGTTANRIYRITCSSGVHSLYAPGD